MAAKGLIHGPPGPNCLHLCIDMQRLFGPGYPWAVPWLERVLPAVEALSAAQPRRSLFTRFIPPRSPEQAGGTWARYYRRWADVTLDRIGPDAVRLVPELERFVPPGRVFDKAVYSPWSDGRLARLLQADSIDTVVITGGETDVCVLAAVMGAIDFGLRTIIVTDALCSSFDETHDALMALYLNRFSEQLEAAETEELLRAWPREADAT